MLLCERPKKALNELIKEDEPIIMLNKKNKLRERNLEFDTNSYLLCVIYVCHMGVFIWTLPLAL